MIHRIANKVLKKIGYRIVPHLPASAEIDRSRVTVKGMENSIRWAGRLFPERKVLAFTDRECDAVKVPFERMTGASSRLISGDPNADFSGIDFSKTVFVFGFDSDQQAIAYLEHVHRQGGKYICTTDINNARWWNINDLAREVLIAEAKDCEKNSYSHFAPDQLANIIQAIDITRGIEGDYVEFGVLQGTSARLAYHYMRRSGLKRNCYFLDTYTGFDYDEAKASPDASWQGLPAYSMETVKKRMDETPPPGDSSVQYELVKANIIADSLPSEIESISICNIDVDIYDGVKAGLIKAWPLLSVGGLCIVQDPGRTPFIAGARLALDEFTRSLSEEEYISVYLESGQTYLIKTAS